MHRFRKIFAAPIVIAVTVLSMVAVSAEPLSSSETLVINPGGGANPEGGDGISIAIDGGSAWFTELGGYSPSDGSDEIRYRNTTQYCCSGVAPMLNIGGTLHGDGGPANHSSGTPFTVEVVETTGTAFVFGADDGEGEGGIDFGEEFGDFFLNEAPDTGSGTAVVRYTTKQNDLIYSFDRTITYVYPNNYFTDEYTFAIPEGNTEIVKFYLGGDTAPGNSDSGTGVETTEPVRTIYSVNPSSEIQVGFGEIPGTPAFDGAVVGSYYAPFDTVRSGNDIGFDVNTSQHDAGIMMQWTLGDEAGTHERALRQVMGARGASLSSTLVDPEVEFEESASFLLEVLNTSSTAKAGIDVEITLPEGLSLAADATTTCDATLVAPADGSAISLTEASVDGAANCLVEMELSAAAPGEFTIASDILTSASGIENSIGQSTLTVAAPPEPEPEPETEPETEPEIIKPAPSCSRTIAGAFAEASGNSGVVSRLYMATFLRSPDSAGHDFWVEALDSGDWTVAEVASFFGASDEFSNTYGTTDDGDFVDLLYGNALCRGAEEEGRNFWLTQIEEGQERTTLLLFFSQSAEFKQLTTTS